MAILTVAVCFLPPTLRRSILIEMFADIRAVHTRTAGASPSHTYTLSLARSLSRCTTHRVLGRMSIPSCLTSPAPHAQLSKLYTAEEAAAFSANGAPRATHATRFLSLLLRCFVICCPLRRLGTHSQALWAPERLCPDQAPSPTRRSIPTTTPLATTSSTARSCPICTARLTTAACGLTASGPRLRSLPSTWRPPRWHEPR